MTARALLFVEDDPDDRFLIGRALRRIDCQLPTVLLDDGVELFDYLTRADALPPALIVLDLNMPRLDGRDVLCRLREAPALAAIPVVVLTTSTEASDHRQALALGAVAVEIKPESIAELAERLRTIVARAEAAPGLAP